LILAETEQIEDEPFDFTYCRSIDDMIHTKFNVFKKNCNKILRLQTFLY
jgi:hypothetical protein